MSLNNSINGYFYVADVRNIFVQISLKRTKPYDVFTVLKSSFAKDMNNVSEMYKANLVTTLGFLSSDIRNNLVKVRNNITNSGGKAIYSNDIVVSTFGRSLIGFGCNCSSNELCLHWMSNFCYQNVPPNDMLLFRPHPNGIEKLKIDWKLFGQKVTLCINCPTNIEVNNYVYNYTGESIYNINVAYPIINSGLTIYPNNYANLRPIQSRSIRPKENLEYLNNEDNLLLYQKDEDEGMMELGESDYGEMPQPKTFNNYTPKRVSEGYCHPDPIIESYSLSQVDPPEINIKLKLIEKRPEIIETGLLSNLQLESVYYATQCHEETIDGKYRRGFFIGDGAGVGKGRQVSAIIAEQYLRGNNRHIWFSVSNDLLYDSTRDLKDIHFNEINIYSLAKAKYGSLEKDNNYGDGVLYCTYNNLISTRQNGRNNYNESRFYQILNWCGGGDKFEGVIVFDECHRAKNLSINSKGQSSKTAKAVIDLQMKLPHAKVVYCSATGVSELKNLCYMSRLGLWGSNTPFTNFPTFLKTVEQRGIGALEFFAMELKHLGLYVSRQLSYEGASFECVLADTKELREIYDESVRFWRKLRREFSQAYDISMKYSQNTDNNTSSPHDDDDDVAFSIGEFEEESSIELNRVWCYFWGCCQRFFRFMCIALKVPTVIDLAMKELKNGKSVVIGLQSTGEARTKAAMSEQATVTEFISAPQGILTELIDKAFPLPPTPESVKEERRQQIIERIEKERAENPRPTVKRNKNIKLANFIEADTDEDTNSDDDFDHVFDGGSDEDNDKDSGLSSDELSEILCYECNIDENDAQLLICDRCLKRGCHIYCLNPPLSSIPNSKWYCNICDPIQKAEAEEAERKRKEEEEKRKKYDEELREVYDKLIAKKNELKKMVEQMKLPPNPLDELIDKLGGPSKVAEMTGRAIHLVRTKVINSDGSISEAITMQKRNKDLRRSGSESDKECSLDEVNLAEKDLFLSGKKLVAIISEAASSGISLQADKRVRNQRRRVHITLELPWSAEKAIQQLGRTHRSNQSTAPEYKFVLTDIGGEKRFAAAVGNRLKVLGAITQGDRLANNAFQLDAFTVDYSLGNEALLELTRIIKLKDKARKIDCPIKIRITESTYLPDSSYGSTISQMEEWLEDITLFKDGVPDIFPKSHKKRTSRTNAMDKFLNRLLCLEVEKQNVIVNFFTDLLEYYTDQKKKSGTFDDGISDIQGKNITLKDKNIVFNDKRTNSITYHYVYEINTGMPWDEAEALKEKNKNGSFYKSKKSWFGYDHYIYAEPYPDQKSDEVILLKQKFHLKGNIYKVYRSNSGYGAKPMSEEDLLDKYQLSAVSIVEKAWKSNYEKSGRVCLHNGKCLLGDKCQKGKRIRSIHVLAGNILPIWETVSKKLDDMGNRRQQKLAKSDQRLKIVRITTDDSKIYGLRVSSLAIDEILETLKKKQEKDDNGQDGEEEKKNKNKNNEGLLLSAKSDEGDETDEMKSLKELKYTISESNESGNDSSSVTPLSDYVPIKNETNKQMNISNFSKEMNIENKLKSENNYGFSSQSRQTRPSIMPPKEEKKKKSKHEDIVDIEDEHSSDDDEDNQKISIIKQVKEEMKVKRKNSPVVEETSVVTKLLKTTPSFIPDSTPLKAIVDENSKSVANRSKICPECSGPNRFLAKFCDNCGHRF